jgi:hypothetical protein
MKPDSMIVEPEYIMQALQAVAGQGPLEALAQFQQQEPVLASFIEEKLAALAGRLGLSGAPPELVRGTHAEALLLVLGSIESLRRGHFELWKGTTFGAQLPQPGEPVRRRRRKKGADPQEDPGT